MSKLILRNIGKSFGDFQAVNDTSSRLRRGVETIGSWFESKWGSSEKSESRETP